MTGEPKVGDIVSFCDISNDGSRKMVRGVLTHLEYGMAYVQTSVVIEGVPTMRTRKIDEARIIMKKSPTPEELAWKVEVGDDW